MLIAKIVVLIWLLMKIVFVNIFKPKNLINFNYSGRKDSYNYASFKKLVLCI